MRATGLDDIMVATSVCTGGRDIPPECPIGWVRVLSLFHTIKCPAPDGARHFMVRATGLEPARLSQRNLNPPSLPIPPRPQIEFPEYFITTQDGCQLSRMLLSRMGKLYQKFRRFPLTFRQSTSRIDSVWCTLKIVLFQIQRFIDNRRELPGVWFFAPHGVLLFDCRACPVNDYAQFYMGIQAPAPFFAY